MKRSTKVTSILIVFFLIIAGVIIGRTMIGKHFEKKFSKRPPPEIILTTVEMKGYTVASEDGYTIAIPTEITDSLRLEGIARELVHRIQNMRREAGFEISDNIHVFYEAGPELETVFSQHGEYIKIETLASNLEPVEPTTGSYVEDHEIEGHNIKIGVMLV